MSKPHICILTTAHPIDDVRVNEKFAQSFLSAGFRVTWVGPGHAFFDKGARRASAIEFHLAPGNYGPADRLMASVRVYRIARALTDIDVYYAPEPDSASVALRLARRNGAKVILDLHEIYHGAMLKRWLRGLAIAPIRECVRRRIAGVCHRCDLVVGVSEAVLRPYEPPSGSTVIVRSCAPSWFAKEPASDVCAESRPRFTLMHGKRSLQRGTLRVLESLAGAAKVASNLRVLMFNQIPPARDPEYPIFAAAMRKHQLGDVVELRDGVPIREMAATLRECDVGLVAYGKKLGVDSLPNRLFEYMAAGVPVIVPSYAPEMASIVKSERCGVTADFENIVEIEEAIIYLWKNPNECRAMGQRGREAFIKRHNWEVEFRPVLDKINAWKNQPDGTN